MSLTPAERFRDEAIIIIDTREQRPWAFPGHRIARLTLEAGDYAVAGLERCVAIERKSLGDLFGTVGAGRARFERELERLAKIKYPAIVVEGDLRALVASPPPSSHVHPASVIGSLVAWSIRNGIHVWFASDRSHAQSLARKILEMAWKAVSSQPPSPSSP